MPPIARPSMMASKRPSRSASAISSCCALHELPHEGRDVVAPHVLGVRALVALDDAPAVGEEVRDDVRLVEAAVLGLDVEGLALVLDVVVEADLRAQERRARDLALEPSSSSSADQRAIACVERRVLARDPLHPLEGELRELRRRVDAQRLGEQVLPLGVVRRRSRPTRRARRRPRPAVPCRAATWPRATRRARAGGGPDTMTLHHPRGRPARASTLG